MHGVHEMCAPGCMPRCSHVMRSWVRVVLGAHCHRPRHLGCTAMRAFVQEAHTPRCVLHVNLMHAPQQTFLGALLGCASLGDVLLLGRHAFKHEMHLSGGARIRLCALHSVQGHMLRCMPLVVLLGCAYLGGTCAGMHTLLDIKCTLLGGAHCSV